MAINDIDSSLVTVGKPVEGGCVWTAFTKPKAFPTDATTKMSTLTEFVSLGDLSTNGFTEGKAISSSTHKGWHGKVVITSVDEETNTVKLEFIEVNRPSVAKLRYGDAAVTEGEDGSVSKILDKGYDGKAHPFVIDELESGGFLRRTIIRSATVTSFDDVPHQRGSLMVYGATLTVNEPEDGSAAIEIHRAKPGMA